MTYVGTGGAGNGNIPFWKCIRDNNANQPDPDYNGRCLQYEPYWIPSYWNSYIPVVYVVKTPPLIGLNAISSQVDMADNFTGYYQFPFPVGVPGQPFNPAPRRLLNSILRLLLERCI
jgi:hypothetical protein